MASLTFCESVENFLRTTSKCCLEERWGIRFQRLVEEKLMSIPFEEANQEKPITISLDATCPGTMGGRESARPAGQSSPQ